MPQGRAGRSDREGEATHRRGWPRTLPALALAALLGSAACSGGGDGGGGGLLSFRRSEAPKVDGRLSAGSRTDQLVLAGGTAQRIAAFELTRARIDRWLQAQDYLAAVAEQDPSVGRVLQGADDERGADDPAVAIDQAIGRLQSHGAVQGALARLGSSPAEFVLTGLAMHQAFLASTPSAPERLRRLAARNLRVMQRHEALFQRSREVAPLRYAYLDSLGWYDPDDTTAVAGDPYDPYADPYAADTTDTLAVPDSVWDSLPRLPDTLPRPVDRSLPDSLTRRRLPVVDSLRPPPPVPLPLPVPPRLPPRPDSARPDSVRPPPSP